MPAIKKLIKIEQPREKIKKYGAERLSSPELLALILRTGTSRRNVLKLSEKIMEVFGEDGLPMAKADDLEMVPGVGPVKAFPVQKDAGPFNEGYIEGELEEISKHFSSTHPTASPFQNAGIMIDRKFYTVKLSPRYNGKRKLLGDVVIDDDSKVPEEFFIEGKDIAKWEHLKNGKKELRRTKTGHEYHYSEGPVAFPDPLDKPSRTIVTGEGGCGPSRFKHVIRTRSGRLRRLMPVELEQLDMFPKDHTKFMLNKKLTPDTKRAFIAGNALVVGVIRKLGNSLRHAIEDNEAEART